MKSIAKWFRSVRGNVPEPESGAEPASGSGSTQPADQGSLFHCPACETVYVAVEKQTCSSCDVAVEAVPSTMEDI